MGKENVNTKKEPLNIPVMIFCIIGTVLLVLGALLIKSNNFKLNIFKAEGTVTSVQTSVNANGEIESRSLLLSYKGGRSDYNATLVVPADSTKTMGDKITLYYDFFNPDSVSEIRTGYQGYLALIIGLILVLKTAPRFIRNLKDNYL